MNTLDTWIQEVAEALDVPADVVDRDAILDLARVAAHNVARPAAPLTTYLAGYAAGLRGRGPDHAAETIRIATEAAERAAEPRR